MHIITQTQLGNHVNKNILSAKYFLIVSDCVDATHSNVKFMLLNRKIHI